MEPTNVTPDDELAALLQPGESLRHRAQALEALIAVTDRRIIVKAGERVALDLPIDGLRRIQLDVERRRPATLVLVPEEPHHEPQVLSIPAERPGQVVAAMAMIGRQLGDGIGAS